MHSSINRYSRGRHGDMLAIPSRPHNGRESQVVQFLVRRIPFLEVEPDKYSPGAGKCIRDIFFTFNKNI